MLPEMRAAGSRMHVLLFLIRSLSCTRHSHVRVSAKPK